MSMITKEDIDNTILLLGDKELGYPFLPPPNMARFGKPIHKNKSKQRRARRKSQRTNRK